MLAKKYRIHGEKRFKEIYKQGTYFFTRMFNIRYLSNNMGYPRFATVISAKTSKKATDRNKVRRQLSELYKEISANLNRSNDYVLVVKKPFIYKEWPEKKKELIQAFKRAKLRIS